MVNDAEHMNNLYKIEPSMEHIEYSYGFKRKFLHAPVFDIRDNKTTHFKCKSATNFYLLPEVTFKRLCINWHNYNIVDMFPPYRTYSQNRNGRIYNPSIMIDINNYYHSTLEHPKEE